MWKFLAGVVVTLAVIYPATTKNFLGFGVDTAHTVVTTAIKEAPSVSAQIAESADKAVKQAQRDEQANKVAPKAKTAADENEAAVKAQQQSDVNNVPVVERTVK